MVTLSMLVASGLATGGFAAGRHAWATPASSRVLGAVAGDIRQAPPGALSHQLGPLAQHPSMPRRAQVLALLMAALSFAVRAPRARAATTGPNHDQVVRAANVLHSLQTRWPSIEAQGAAGAAQVLEELTGTLNSVISISVPPGGSVGVEIEDRTVVGINRPELGWQIGDFVMAVNGVEVSNQEKLVAATQEARSKGGTVVYSVRRLQESPFVTIVSALEKIYRDADSETPLSEPEDVARAFRDLKNKAALAQDGIIELPRLREKLDELTKLVESFAAA